MASVAATSGDVERDLSRRSRSCKIANEFGGLLGVAGIDLGDPAFGADILIGVEEDLDVGMRERRRCRCRGLP